MEGTNSKITMFAHFQEYHRNRKLFRMFFIVCKLNSLLNSSTIDELGEGDWKDGGASSTGAVYIRLTEQH